MDFRLALFASHRGSVVRTIVDAVSAGQLQAQPVLLIGNNSRSQCFDIAHENGLVTAHLSSATHPSPDNLDAAILHQLNEHQIDLVVLAGYMKRLGPQTVRAYRNRIINVHPSLLPLHGGQGMYGDAVHQDVLASGDTVSGASVIMVDEEYDHGPVIAQCTVPVHDDDTLETLKQRVQEAEGPLYVETIAAIQRGDIDLDQLAAASL
jgi:phosphoribosylglycinamide formyltransferase 1